MKPTHCDMFRLKKRTASLKKKKRNHVILKFLFSHFLQEALNSFIAHFIGQFNTDIWVAFSVFTFLLTVPIMFLNLLSFGKLSDGCSRLDPGGSLEHSGKHRTAV